MEWEVFFTFYFYLNSLRSNILIVDLCTCSHMILKGLSRILFFILFKFKFLFSLYPAERFLGARRNRSCGGFVWRCSGSCTPVCVQFSGPRDHHSHPVPLILSGFIVAVIFSAFTRWDKLPLFIPNHFWQLCTGFLYDWACKQTGSGRRRQCPSSPDRQFGMGQGGHC